MAPSKIVSLAGVSVVLATATVYTLQQIRSQSSSNSPPNLVPASSKNVSASSISYTSRVLPEHCDAAGRCYGGTLLMLIDVSFL